jgi:hypothetical protein
MKLKILVIGLILVAACFSGCIGTTSKTTYQCTADGDDGVLYLSGISVWKDTGTYQMLIDDAHGGGGIHGTYGIENGKVLLNSFLGMIIEFDMDGRDLIDPDGDRWVRD